MTRLSLLVPAAVALALSANGALADAYPVSGRWTYENASRPGPAKICGGRTMEFRGAQRFDTGGGVPQYRNVSVDRASPGLFAVVDEFFNVQTRGRVTYALRILDEDHIVLRLALTGATIPLRRCG